MKKRNISAFSGFELDSFIAEEGVLGSASITNKKTGVIDNKLGKQPSVDRKEISILHIKGLSFL